MIATVHLSQEELQDLREFTSMYDPAAAVRTALDEYRRYARRTRLKKLSGQMTMEDHWRVMGYAEENGPCPD